MVMTPFTPGTVLVVTVTGGALQGDVAAALGNDREISCELNCVAETILGEDENAFAGKIFARVSRLREIAGPLRDVGGFESPFKFPPAFGKFSLHQQQMCKTQVQIS